MANKCSERIASQPRLCHMAVSCTWRDFNFLPFLNFGPPLQDRKRRSDMDIQYGRSDVDAAGLDQFEWRENRFGSDREVLLAVIHRPPLLGASHGLETTDLCSYKSRSPPQLWSTQVLRCPCFKHHQLSFALVFLGIHKLLTCTSPPLFLLRRLGQITATNQGTRCSIW